MKKTLFLLLMLGSMIKADIKPIFIIVYDTNCNACNKTISMIAKNRELSKAITTLTKPFQMTVEEAGKNNLLVRTVPTFFLLDPNTNQMLVAPLEGAITDPNDFTRFLQQVHSELNH